MYGVDGVVACDPALVESFDWTGNSSLLEGAKMDSGSEKKDVWMYGWVNRFNEWWWVGECTPYTI